MNQQAHGFVYVQTNDANINEVIVYRREDDGRLERLGSYLTGGKGSGKPHLPSQSSVVLAGDRLFVTNAGSDDVTVFAVRDDQLAALDRAPSGGSAPTSIAVHGERAYVLNTSGATPYGFDFTPDGTVIVTEAAGAEVGKASASSYRLHGGGELTTVSGAIQNTRSEVCWAVVSKDARTAFVTNFGDGTISTYAIGDDGSIELREAVAATTVEGRPGIRDEAISSDGRYLYALHADAREVFAWEVAADGTLTALGSANGLPATAAGLAAS